MRRAFQDLLDAMDGLAWVVDRDGLIQAIGHRNWARFAIANGAPELAEPRNVLGRPLIWSVIGNEVQALYRRIMDDVLEGRRESTTIPCRCDAPDVGREMRLAISPLGAAKAIDGLLFHSTTLGEEERPPINLYDFRASAGAPEVAGRSSVLAMCSLCQRVRYPPGEVRARGEWIAPEEHYRRGGSSDVRIIHTVCRDCYDRIGVG